MRIDEFEWTHANESKLARRGYVMRAIDSTLEARFVVLRNKRGRAGTHRLIGRMADGRLVTVVIRSTNGPGIWRPVNAWPCDSEELTYARKNAI